VKTAREVNAGGVTSGNGSKAPEQARREAASALIKTHDAVFRRTARRYSLCADDAEDAYQRALEIFLTKAPPTEGDALVRWMQVVTKREAMAVRRQRERMLNGRPPADSGDERDPIDLIASDAPDPTDRAEASERVARSREALKALKPQEVRALTLKAEGYSYAEIGEITGWTYTKINRCMAEGRKRFLEVFAEIEQGRRCEQLADELSAFADGEPGDGSLLEVHLRSCVGCRAKLRAFRAIPARVYELLPTGPALDQSAGGGAREWVSERAAAVIDKARETAYSLTGAGHGGEAAGGALAGAGQKVAAVCAGGAAAATCFAGGVVGPGVGGVDVVKGEENPAIERPAEESSPVETSPPPTETPVEATPAPAPATPAPSPTPEKQLEREIGFEASAPSGSGGGGASSSEFGGPSGGGGSGGGGSGRGGGEFGIE